MTTASDRLELLDPAGYRARLKTALDGRRPLDVLGETPGGLRGIVADRSADLLRQRPFADKWTPNEILSHLMDVEWVFGYRTRTMVCDDRPTLIGIDQDLWVRTQRHNERDPGEILDTFSALRRLNLVFWGGLTGDQLERVGVHSERGDESVGLMLTMLAGHDLVHIDQLRRYLDAVDDRGPS
jgi:hypothetical protein